MICVKDDEMDVVHLSLEWYGFTGVDEGDALGRGWLCAVHPDDRAVVDEILDGAARHRSGYSMVYRLLHRSGSSMPSTLTCVSKDLMADSLLLARSLADQEGERAIVEAMDFALYLTRKRLARTSH